MYEVSKKNKTIFLIIFLVLLLGGVFAGTYFILQKYVKKENFLDKHGDVVSYCEREKGSSIYKCNLLLEDLVPNVDGKTCFDVQIISNDTIVPTRFCEEEQYLSLSNEIVQYKKLKPLTVTFTYVSNRLTNILFEPISETYIQDLVNRDINSFIALYGGEDYPDFYENSLDFCPKPSLLPDYVEKKSEYTSIYNNKILKEVDYKNDSISKILACKSSQVIGYNNLCDKGDTSQKQSVLNVLKDINIDEKVIAWNNGISSDDRTSLLLITTLYDKLFLRERVESSLLQNIAGDVKAYFSNLTEVDGLAICVLSELANDLGDNILSQYINSLIISNIDKEVPSLCLNAQIEEYDKEGAYIKGVVSRLKGIMLTNNCINLTNLFK